MSEICVSISGKTINECIKQTKNTDFAELRLDISVLNKEEIDFLMTNCPKWIVSIREGIITNPNFLNLLKKSLDNNPSYVDIDLDFFKSDYSLEIKELLKSYNFNSIISYHNFEKTPTLIELEKIVDEIFSYGAQIAKISCLAIELRDNSIMAQLHEKYDNIIAFCMGEKGKISRVSSLFQGIKITYAAPDNGEKTALGQFRRNEMFQLLQIMNSKR